MSALIKLLIIDEEPEEQNNPDQNESHEGDEDTDEWHEVGAKNKSLLVRIEFESESSSNRGRLEGDSRSTRVRIECKSSSNQTQISVIIT